MKETAASVAFTRAHCTLNSSVIAARSASWLRDMAASGASVTAQDVPATHPVQLSELLESEAYQRSRDTAVEQI